MPSLLHALTAASGLSRRKAFAAIREGHVTVDRELRTEPSSEYEGGLIAIDGRLLDTAARAHVYLMLNKPPDYITTVSDEMGRRTVLDLIPARLKAPGIHPVGRLDRDTSGLLLLTTDGDLTHALTHPQVRDREGVLAAVGYAPDGPAGGAATQRCRDRRRAAAAVAPAQAHRC